MTNILLNNAGKNGQDFFCGINRLPDIDHLKKLIFHHHLIFQGRDPVLVGDRDMDKALAYTLRDVLFEYWIITQRRKYHKKSWWQKSILNVARIGKFSTDRTIREYAEDIWGLKI